MDDLLYALLLASITVSVLLALISTALVGRKVADLEYQQSTGVNGAVRIQAIVNIRTHALRVFVGLTFIIISALLLADAPIPWRSWVNRVLFVALPGTYAVASVLDWLAERRQIKIHIAQAARNRDIASTLEIAAERERTAALRADHDSYKEMVAEAIASLAIVAARARLDHGQEPLATVAPVIGEHNSPITPEQRATAERQTLRAKLVAATLDLGLPTRGETEAGAPADAVHIPIGQSLGDMAVAAGGTLQSAEKTVAAAEIAVEAISAEQERREP